MTEQNQDPAKPYWDKQLRQLMLKHDKRAQSLLAPPGSVAKCDECEREGKLVIQDPMTHFGQRWVFRAYFCPWHLGAHNKWRKTMGPRWKKLVPLEWKSDEELLSQNSPVLTSEGS